MDQDLLATPVTHLVCSKCGHQMGVEGREAFSTVPCEKCQTPLTVPVMLGSFLLLERMGTGGMGAVYRGLDTSLNRFVAIKVMKSALGEDAKLVESFIREARAAATLNHRNIVQIYSCGQERGQPYIVMELVTGGKMNHLFKVDQPLDEVKLLKISLDVAEGLKAANEVGLVHGDIKPENVLLDSNGTAKIVDFGLAQFVNAQKDRGEIWGTPYYISPERARGNKADHRSDIYSLGATMFHALTGTPPFDGPTPVDVVVARLKHPPPDLRTLRPDAQEKTVDLINRMMVADPSLRYPNSASLMSDMKSALEAAKTARKEMAHPVTQKKNTSSRVIAIIAIAAMAGLAGWLLHRVRTAGEKTVSTPNVPAGKTPESDAPLPMEGKLRSEQVTGPDGVARTVIRLNVFKDDISDRLTDAARLCAEGRPRDGGQIYMNEAKDMFDRTGRNWILLLQVASSWIASDSSKVWELLNHVAGTKLKTSIEPSDPSYMPVALAKLLLGKISEAEISRQETAWPSWFNALRCYMQGLQDAQDEKFAEARAKFDLFLARTDSEPSWIYAFRPHAADWIRRYQDAADAAREVEQRLSTGKIDEAKKLYDLYYENAAPVMRAALEPLQDRFSGVEQPVTPVDDGSSARKERQEVQSDLDRIDAAMAGISAAILRERDFRRAALSLNALPADMKTAQGRTAAAQAQQQVQKLEGLRAFVIQSTSYHSFPRREGCDLDGDLVAATPLGVRVTLDGRSVTTVTWDTIPVRSFVRIVDYYASSGRIPAKDRAQALVSLALLSLLNGAVEPARSYAQRALEVDATIEAEARSLLPGLLP